MSVSRKLANALPPLRERMRDLIAHYVHMARSYHRRAMKYRQAGYWKLDSISQHDRVSRDSYIDAARMAKRALIGAESLTKVRRMDRIMRRGAWAERNAQ